MSATTRAPRPGESDGVDYHFLGKEEFARRVAAGRLRRARRLCGRSYGTLRSELEDRVRAGAPVVLEIEVQGARQVRAAMPEAVQVFIAPPSLEALRTRLIGRGTDDGERGRAAPARGRAGARGPARVRPRGRQRSPRGRPAAPDGDRHARRSATPSAARRARLHAPGRLGTTLSAQPGKVSHQ